MKIKLLNYQLYLHDTKTRIPFRFGISTLKKAPQGFLNVDLAIEGEKSTGISSECLLPKWFTKNPEVGYEQEIYDMIDVIINACEIGKTIGEQPSFFEFWKELTKNQEEWANKKHIAGLLWNLGVSLLERAMIDAICRYKKINFKQLLQSNLLEINPGEIFEELKGKSVSNLISFIPNDTIYARHTVGMTDYLRQSEIPIDEKVCDGLPQAFEDCVAEYGISRYKIKLSGEINRDVNRLLDISKIVSEKNISEYAFTLDGNENYENANDFKNLWEQLSANKEVCEMLKHLIFVEQPIKRDYALSDETTKIFSNWNDRPPIIIDESDAEIGCVPRAIKCGYNGTSHKNCKGIVKGILNACYLNNLNDDKYILSAEDLVNTGPIALLQDLTMAALLGINHIERNGHHYFKGLSSYSGDLQKEVIDAHPDLYELKKEEFASLIITNGKIQLNSLLNAPFGCGFKIDLNEFTPYNEWINKN